MSRQTINSIPPAEGIVPRHSSVRVCTLGQPDSGKSSLIGVLTSGVGDDGKGSARAPVFAHAHERESGRTSSVSTHVFGYKFCGDDPIKIVYGSEGRNDASVCVSSSSVQSTSSKKKSVAWSHIVRNSDRVVHQTDLCGHESYFKTTIKGLLGEMPDFAVLVVNGSASVSQMTSVHQHTCRALGLPLVILVTKIDKTPVPVLKNTKAEVENAVRSIGRYPEIIKTPAQAVNVGALVHRGVVPIIFTSLVTMQYLELLHYTMLSIEPVNRASCIHGYSFGKEICPDDKLLHTYVTSCNNPEGDVRTVADACTAVPRLSISDVYSTHLNGVIVSGHLVAGTLIRGERGFIGPNGRGKFTPVVISSIHCDRVPVESSVAGEMTSVLVQLDKERQKEMKGSRNKVSLTKNLIKKGMQLVMCNTAPECPYTFKACIYVSSKDSTTITKNYEAVLHLSYAQTTCQVVGINVDSHTVAAVTGRPTDAPKLDEPSCFENITHSVTGKYPPLEGYQNPVPVEKKDRRDKKDKRDKKEKKKKDVSFDDEKADNSESKLPYTDTDDSFVSPGCCAIVTLKSMKPILTFPGDVFVLRHGRISASGVVIGGS